jgi:hypothetical protein
MDANDRITRIKKDSVGEQKIKDLYINGEQVPVVSSMKKNGSGKITELYLNEVKQSFIATGVTADTTVPVWIASNDDTHTQGFIFCFDTDGNIIDDMENADDIEVALFINATGYDGYTTLSEADFQTKYGVELPVYSYGVEFSADTENTKLSCGEGVSYTYNSTLDDITIFKLAALGRYN